MKVIDLSKENSILNKFMSELRDVNIQQDRMRFRENIRRIGHIEAYEVSKLLSYSTKKVQTPLAVCDMNTYDDDVVIATVFRAGLPMHQGFLDFFDEAGNSFLSAYRYYTDKECTKVDVKIEYMASPLLSEKTLLIVDPMLATGGSMEMGYKALLTKGTPKKVHVVCVMAAPEGIEHIRKTFPEDTTIWCAAIDPGLNEHKYIVPGFGDAGDLCYGGKI